MTEILIIGGGFFGMYLAEHFAAGGCRVRLVEKEAQFMSRASYANQARVHNGYHYPRSVLTALRSRVSFPCFVDEFRECIDSDFEKYYLIASRLGKVSATQFKRFCERIGAHCEPASWKIRSLVNPSLIEDCFSVVEYAFDAVKLRDVMIDRLGAAGVERSMETSVETVRPHGKGVQAELLHLPSRERHTVEADHVFNCTYSGINHVVSNSRMEIIPLKHEMTEMCLVEMPDQLKRVGITVMCGPFFSAMPFPPAGLHSFSHVRYTPHYEWQDGQGGHADAYARSSAGQRHSAWRYMQKDAARYLPLLSECGYRDSIWEVKTVLPRSESDDSRPILFLPNYGIKGFHCLMGGKMDNVYDALDAIASHSLVAECRGGRA